MIPILCCLGSAAIGMFFGAILGYGYGHDCGVNSWERHWKQKLVMEGRAIWFTDNDGGVLWRQLTDKEITERYKENNHDLTT